MPAARNIAFLASETDLAQEAKARLEAMYGRFAPRRRT
jgi:NAD+ kinase